MTSVVRLNKKKNANEEYSHHAYIEWRKLASMLMHVARGINRRSLIYAHLQGYDLIGIMET